MATIIVSCEHDIEHQGHYPSKDVVVTHNLSYGFFSYAFTCRLCRRRSVLPLTPEQAGALLEVGCSMVEWTNPILEKVNEPPLTETEVLDLISDLYNTRITLP